MVQRACVRDCSGNDFGGNAFPGETEVPLDASRLAEWWWVLNQNHWSGKPDGAAALDCVCGCDVISAAAPARPNQKKDAKALICAIRYIIPKK
jgi:hypothetical protein